MPEWGRPDRGTGATEPKNGETERRSNSPFRADRRRLTVTQRSAGSSDAGDYGVSRLNDRMVESVGSWNARRSNWGNTASTWPTILPWIASYSFHLVPRENT